MDVIWVSVSVSYNLFKVVLQLNLSFSIKHPCSNNPSLNTAAVIIQKLYWLKWIPIVTSFEVLNNKIHAFLSILKL